MDVPGTCRLLSVAHGCILSLLLWFSRADPARSSRPGESGTGLASQPVGGWGMLGPFLKPGSASVQSLSRVRLCDPMDCSTPGFPVHHQVLEPAQAQAIRHLILSRPLLLLPSIFPSIRVFSNESVLHMRWPKFWSFSFSISPSNEYSGSINSR